MRFFRPLVLIATILAFGVIALGAYVRLKDAGLGCPDWPGCYGHLLGVPDAPHELAKAEQHFPDSPVVVAKAWTEMAHRYLAGTLGLLVAAIGFLALKHGSALKQSAALPIALVGVVVFQALLGMWTVTLLLKPAVVTAHLLGGMTTLALLLWLLHSSADSRHTAEGDRRVCRARYPVLESNRLNENLFAHRHDALTGSLRTHAALALLAVIVQIALGGWVSTNYAALACTDFPTCNGAWLPEMDFSHAYRIVRELGQTADGEPLSYAALTAIHWTHRAGALVVTLIAGSLATRLLMSANWRRWGILLSLALLSQIGLGISAVLLFLPLPVAVAHNAGAAVLLSITLAVNLKLASSSRALQGIRASREVVRYKEVVHE